MSGEDYPGGLYISYENQEIDGDDNSNQNNNNNKYAQNSDSINASAESRSVNRLAEHSQLLLKGLTSLRCCKKLFDVTLVVEGRKFQGHRIILAACSDYFCAMFTDEMLESRMKEIEINDVPADGMAFLIDYIYTSKLELTRDNVQDVLIAASHIQMKDVVDECSSFLELQIELDNCLSIAALADLYSLKTLRQRAYRYICSRFVEFMEKIKIRNIPYDQMEYILHCDYPVNCPEYVLLDNVMRYIAIANLSNDEMTGILRHIKYFYITDKEYKSIMNTNYEKYAIRECDSKYFDDSKGLIVTMKQMQTKLKAEIETIPRTLLINPRGMELALVKIGGFESKGLTNQISCYILSKMQWYNLTVIPHIEQCNYGSAVLGNELFIVGGSYDVCLKEYIHPFGFRYCPLKNLWNTIAPIQSDRCRFSLNAVGDNYLYAVGGVGESHDHEGVGVVGHNTSNCERYNAKENVWEYMAPLTEDRSQHAGCVWKDNLYISGGLDRHIVLSSFWCFNHHTETWSKLPAMPTPRADHVLVPYKGKLYACGGWYEDPRTENRVLVDEIEVYDIATKEWSLETRNPISRFYAGITVLNCSIYFVGGLLSTSAIDRASSSVACYHIPSKKWIFCPTIKYPKKVWESTAVAFYVPREVDNFKHYWAKNEN